MLILQRKIGESLVIDKDITISVVSIDGTRVRLAISAPEHIQILRSELVKAAAANQESAVEDASLTTLFGALGEVLPSIDTQVKQNSKRKEESP